MFDACYTENNPLPISGQATILDFSWPPSIEVNGVSSEHVLLGMKHWIQVARNIDHSEYTTLMDKGDKLIENIQDRYMEALTNKNEARFRAFIYGHMEDLSASWESSSSAKEKEIPQLGAFAREIATWICQQNTSFYLSELTNYVNSTNRSLSSNLLAEVSRDVETSIRTLARLFESGGLMPIRIGTRSSNLAMWQARTVASALHEAGIETEIVQFKSMGDRSLGGNLSSAVGQFIHLIDQKLKEGVVDISVHSSKDVPTKTDDTVANLAYMKRSVTNDLILFNRQNDEPSLYNVLDDETSTSLSDLLNRIEHGSTFGTVSGRRQSLLLSRRPDLIPLSVRGHVETRIERLIEGRVDALVLAEAGIRRLRTTGVLDEHNEHLTAYRISSEDWPTAPGQGTVCIHCKSERSRN